MASATEIQEMLAAMQASFIDALAKQRKEIQDSVQNEIALLKAEVAIIRSASASSPLVTLTPPNSDRPRVLDEQN